MQSSGGLCDVGDRARAVHPDAGVGAGGGRRRARARSATSLGTRNVICFDMGGTTAKACVLQRRQVAASRATTSSAATTKVWSSAFRSSTSRKSARAAAASPGSTKPAGCTSGRESAGREPGPACYGAAATQPTVTDAHLVLGRLSADRFLGGRMRARREPRQRARSRRTSRSRSASTSPTAAGGILAIANATMANAVRAVTTERGLDPRDFALVAYGGAGPLHAVDVARELAIRTVIDPGRARALLGVRHADGRSAARIRAHARRAA